MVGLATDDMLKTIDSSPENDYPDIEDLAAALASRDGAAVWIPVPGRHLANALVELPHYPGMSLVKVGPSAGLKGHEPAYVARGVYEGSIIPAYCGFHLQEGARAIVDGCEVEVSRYQVLVSKPGEYHWQALAHGDAHRENVTPNVVCGGIRRSHEGHLQDVLICRWRSDEGGWVCGTVEADEAPPRYASSLDSKSSQMREVLLRDIVRINVPATSSSGSTETPKALVKLGSFWTDNHWTHVLPAGHYSSAIHFPERLATVPRIIVGLSKLDMDRCAGGAAIRVRAWPQNVTKEGFICNAQAWSDTYLFNAEVDWAAIEEPHWQCGVFRTTDHREPWVDAHNMFDHRITFERPFTSPPTVLVCFSSIDLSGSWDLRTYATNVDHTGFNLSVVKDGGKELWAVYVTWLAIPGPDILKRRNAWIGQFSTAGRRDVVQVGSCDGHVEFGIKFERPPKIFLGLNHFHMHNTANLRLIAETSNVTESGMDWNIRKWDDSVLEGASVMYLAVDAD